MARKLLPSASVFLFLSVGYWIASAQGWALQAQEEPARAQEQHLEVTVEEGTGNYIFRYQAPDGSPIEVVFVPATKIKPEVRVAFSFDPATGLTTYEFEISNGKSSKQELSQFKTKVTPPVESIQRPEGWFPLGPRPATNLVSWLYMKGVTSVSGLVQPRGLLPGQCQDGFSFQSPNLPGVVKVYFRGNAREWPNPPGVTSQIRRQMRPYTWWENDSVRKATIGPAIQISDLEPYDPATHLRRLQENLRREIAAEMIPDEELRRGLSRKLGQARTALGAHRPEEARKHLAALMEELRSEPEANISGELVRAIEINVNYMLARLPQSFWKF